MGLASKHQFRWLPSLHDLVEYRGPCGILFVVPRVMRFWGASGRFARPGYIPVVQSGPRSLAAHEAQVWCRSGLKVATEMTALKNLERRECLPRYMTCTARQTSTQHSQNLRKIEETNGRESCCHGGITACDRCDSVTFWRVSSSPETAIPRRVE